MTPYINRPDYCCHMTQIGRFLVQCGWPELSHFTSCEQGEFCRHPHDRQLTDHAGLIADHAFMPPEPMAEVVP